MSKKRRQYSSQFKAKVAIEAIQGMRTVAELSSQYTLHPTTINGWTRQLLEGASELFESGQRGSKAEAANQQAEVNELYRQIGQLKVERDFLAERSAKLGLTSEKPW